jgi:tetratricopeptide (TPR) repeat protein/DNA-binding XRE family transcriptional regulator
MSTGRRAPYEDFAEDASVDGGGFAARLRACRRAVRLSQQELAERSGLTVRTISNLERGRTKWPYRDSLYRLADALELRDTARAEFIAAAGRRLDPAAPPGGPRPGGGEGRRGDRGRGVPRHLPAPVPAFVGRQAQLAALSQVLHEPGGTAVITAIGGTAGVGKTALAVQWAHQVAAEFPDGQLFVNLRGFDPSGAPVTSAEALRQLLDALQIPADRIPQTVEGQLGLYRSLLAGKRMLVVLDNAHDVTQVRPLLPGSPTCRVIVTSRHQLTSLAAIEAASPLTLDVLTGAEARQLLQQRLGADRLAADPDAVAQIISSCAHLPLALSIIAARAAMWPDLTLTEIAADLAAHPDLDAFTDSEDPAADVRAAFSWSYRQLDPGSARVFRLAGLHPGPGLERYAVAALTGTPVPQAARMLDVLARACMIQPAGPGRYGMHDLLRGYAREQAASQDGEADRHTALTGLFDHYLHTATAAMDAAFPTRRRQPTIATPAGPVPVVTGPAAPAWLAAEQPNLVAVAAYAAEHGWPGHAIGLAATLSRYLDTTGRYPEAITMHTHACHAARLAGDRSAEASALIALGLVDGHQGRYRQATEHLERALSVYRETGDLTGQGRALNYLGLLALRQGRYQQAVGQLEQTLALYRSAGERTGEAHALSNLGVIDLLQGRYQQAAGRQRQALALFRTVSERDGEATVLRRLGHVSLRQGRHQQAASQLQRALTKFRVVGDRQGEASVLAFLGLTSLRQGRYRQADSRLQQALAHYREMDDPTGQAETLNFLGELLLATGRPAAARAEYTSAAALAAQVGDRYEQARAHDGLASACQASGVLAQARRHWQEALTLYTELGAPEADRIRAQLAQLTTTA